MVAAPTTQPGTLVAEPSDTAAVAARTQVDRWSARVFWVAVVAALPALLWLGRDHWFFLDDWWVLTRDGLTSPGYLDGHNGQWMTLLRIDYRLNFELWGLRSYLPYQVPVVLSALAAAVLVRQVTLRLGVRGWIATAATLALLLFGSGRENMVYGFQLSWVGSLVCGLALFLLAEGPPSVTRRDWLALGVAFLGLMTSSVFPAILVGFGVTTLLRRGLRVAAFYAVPIGGVYMAWYLAYGRESATPLELTGETIRFAGRMFWATFDALAQGGVGSVLIAVAGAGLGAAVLRAWRSGTWADAAIPIGLGLSWTAFAALTALARANVLPETYNSGRYLHIGVALLLPLVAAGAEQLARRHILLGVAALVPLAIGLAGNLDLLSHTDWVYRGNRQLIFAMAHSPFVDDVPPDTRVLRSPIDIPLTAGWLARQAADGHVPDPDGVDPVRDLTATASLLLSQEAGATDQPACPRLTAPMTRTLQPRDRIWFGGTISVTTTDGTNESRPLPFMSRDGSEIRALAGPIHVVVRPALGQQPRVCLPGGRPEAT